MALTRTRQQAGPEHWPGSAVPALVLADDHGQLSLLPARRLRFWDHALASSRGFTLDARLAAGSLADGERLLAERARTLVSPANREQLARDWSHLVRTARSRPSSRVLGPLCRDRILAAEPDIRELQRSLRTTLPVPVRGVAMASHLLVDAAGPVHNRRSEVDLSAAIQEAIRQMDPSTGLIPAGRYR